MNGPNQEHEVHAVQMVLTDSGIEPVRTRTLYLNGLYSPTIVDANGVIFYAVTTLVRVVYYTRLPKTKKRITRIKRT